MKCKRFVIDVKDNESSIQLLYNNIKIALCKSFGTSIAENLISEIDSIVLGYETAKSSIANIHHLN